jgi:hypothetical protein
MGAILYQAPVEKYRFSRILCGFFHLGTSKAHNYRVFWRLAAPEQSTGAASTSLRKVPGAPGKTDFAWDNDFGSESS